MCVEQVSCCAIALSLDTKRLSGAHKLIQSTRRRVTFNAKGAQNSNPKPSHQPPFLPPSLGLGHNPKCEAQTESQSESGDLHLRRGNCLTKWQHGRLPLPSPLPRLDAVPSAAYGHPNLHILNGPAWVSRSLAAAQHFYENLSSPSPSRPAPRPRRCRNGRK